MADATPLPGTPAGPDAGTGLGGLPPGMPPIASITAPLIFGGLINLYLFGVLTVQVYLYYLNFPSDTKYFKSLVYGVFFLDTVSTMMTFGDWYHWFAEGFGNLSAIDDVFLSGIDTPMLGSFVAAIVQGFYAYRIYKLERKSRTWIICSLILAAALVQVAGGIMGAVVSFQSQKFSKAKARGQPSVYMIFGAAAIADILIAGTMAFLLLRSKTKIHHKSRAVLKRILNLIVETNILSSSVALLTIILVLVFPNSNYFTCPSMFLGKIYSNSLLLLLNNRAYLSVGPRGLLSQSEGATRLGFGSGGTSSSPSTAVDPSQSLVVFKSEFTDISPTPDVYTLNNTNYRASDTPKAPTGGVLAGNSARIHHKQGSSPDVGYV